MKRNCKAGHLAGGDGVLLTVAAEDGSTEEIPLTVSEARTLGTQLLGAYGELHPTTALGNLIRAWQENTERDPRALVGDLMHIAATVHIAVGGTRRDWEHGSRELWRRLRGAVKKHGLVDANGEPL